MLFVDNDVKWLSVLKTPWGIVKPAPGDSTHHQLSIKCFVSFRKEILTRPVHIFERVVWLDGGPHSGSSEVMMLFAFPLGWLRMGASCSFTASGHGHTRTHTHKLSLILLLEG